MPKPHLSHSNTTNKIQSPIKESFNLYKQRTIKTKYPDGKILQIKH